MSKSYSPLNQQICFPLYALTRELINKTRPYLDQLDITYPQYLVLLILKPDISLKVKQIGQELHLDSGTLTPLLKRMEQKELIIRHRCPKDERSVEIQLTSKGTQTQKNALQISEQLKQQYHPLQKDLETIQKAASELLKKIQSLS